MCAFEIGSGEVDDENDTSFVTFQLSFALSQFWNKNLGTQNYWKILKIVLISYQND